MLFDRLIRPPECGGVLGRKLLAWSTFGVQGRTMLQQGRSWLALGLPSFQTRESALPATAREP